MSYLGHISPYRLSYLRIADLVYMCMCMYVNVYLFHTCALLILGLRFPLSTFSKSCMYPNKCAATGASAQDRSQFTDATPSSKTMTCSFVWHIYIYIYMYMIIYNIIDRPCLMIHQDRKKFSCWMYIYYACVVCNAIKVFMNMHGCLSCWPFTDRMKSSKTILGLSRNW